MIKYSTILIINLIFSFSLYAQDTVRIIAKYKILESIHGNDNLSKFDQNRQGYLILHYDKFNNLNLTNVSFNSGSYSTGPIYLISDTIKLDSSVQKTYKWTFRNSYDKIKGSIIFKLNEKKTDYRTEFTFKSKLKDGTILFYKGYKETNSPTYIIPETILR